MHRLADEIRAHRWVVLTTLDIVVWMLAFVTASALRFETLDRMVPWATTLSLGLLAAGVQVAVGAATRLYESRHRVGSADDAIATTLPRVSGAVVTLIALAWPSGRLLPLSVPVFATLLAVLGSAGGRLLIRRVVERTRRPLAAERALVVGAGEVGSKLVRDMVTDPNSPYVPVGFVDDDPRKQHLRVSGVRVRGTTDEIATLARDLNASAWSWRR